MSNPYERRDRKPQELRDLKLFDIPLTYAEPNAIDRRKSDPIRVAYGEIKISHQSKNMTLRMRYEEWVSKDNPEQNFTDESYIYKLSNPSDDRVITLNLIIKPSDLAGDQFKAKTLFERLDASIHFPEGVGMAVYQKMLDQVAHFAEEYHTCVTHVIDLKFQNVAITSLTPELWSHMFQPLLERNGYQPVSEEEGQWSKVYAPSVSD